MRTKLLINCACNNQYFHYLEALLYSLEASDIDYMVRVEVINVPSYKVAWLKAQKKICDVIVTCRSFGSFEEERGFCTNRRVPLLKTSFSFKEYTHYAYFDVNVIVLKGLDDLIESNMNADFFLYYNDSHPVLSTGAICSSWLQKGPFGSIYYGVMKAGVQIYRNTEFCKKMVGEYYDLVGNDNVKWYADQEALFFVVRDVGGEGMFYNLYANNQISFDDIVPATIFLCRKGRGSKAYDDVLSKAFFDVALGKKRASIGGFNSSEVNGTNQSSSAVNVVRYLCEVVGSIRRKLHL